MRIVVVVFVRVVVSEGALYVSDAVFRCLLLILRVIEGLWLCFSGLIRT